MRIVLLGMVVLCFVRPVQVSAHGRSFDPSQISIFVFEGNGVTTSFVRDTRQLGGWRLARSNAQVTMIGGVDAVVETLSQLSLRPIEPADMVGIQFTLWFNVQTDGVSPALRFTLGDAENHEGVWYRRLSIGNRAYVAPAEQLEPLFAYARHFTPEASSIRLLTYPLLHFA